MFEWGTVDLEFGLLNEDNGMSGDTEAFAQIIQPFIGRRLYPDILGGNAEGVGEDNFHFAQTVDESRFFSDDGDVDIADGETSQMQLCDDSF